MNGHSNHAVQRVAPLPERGVLIAPLPPAHSITQPSPMYTPDMALHIDTDSGAVRNGPDQAFYLGCVVHHYRYCSRDLRR